MANIYAIGSNGHHRVDIFLWATSQSIDNNTSTLAYTVEISNEGSGTYGWDYTDIDPFVCTYSIDGTTRTCTTRTYNGIGKTIASGEITVTHNTDGTRTVPMSFSVTSISDANLIGSCSASGNLVLTAIDPVSTFTMSGTPFTLGSAITFTIIRQSNNFTHTLLYEVGSDTSDIATASSSTSISWTPPSSLGSAVPFSTTVSCKLTLITLNGTEEVGRFSTTVLLAIPNTAPTFYVRVVDTSALGFYFGNFITNGSVLKATISSIVCYNGSYAVSTEITFKEHETTNILAESATKSLSWVADWAGTIDVVFTVTDSRGNTGTATRNFTVYNYFSPTLSITVGRYNDSAGTTPDDGGEYGKITWTSSCPTGIPGYSNSISVKYKQHSSSSWTSVSSPSLSSSYVFSATQNKTYDVQVTLSGTVAGTGVSENIRTALLSTAITFMDWASGGDGISFGRTGAESNAMILGWKKLQIEGTGEIELRFKRTDQNNCQASIYQRSDTNPAIEFSFFETGDSSWTRTAGVNKTSLYPYSTNTKDLGTSSLQWNRIYGKTLYENGTSLASKYAPIISVELNNDSIGWTNGSNAASGSWITLGTYKFPVGRFLVMTRVEFAGNASGNRQIMWTTSDSSSSAWTQQSYSTSAGCTGWTNLQSVFYVNITSSSSRYLRAYQNSGSALATYVYVQVISV